MWGHLSPVLHDPVLAVGCTLSFHGLRAFICLVQVWLMQSYREVCLETFSMPLCSLSSPGANALLWIQGYLGGSSVASSLNAHSLFYVCCAIILCTP